MTPRRALVVLFLLTLPLVTLRIRGADEIEYFSYLRSLAFDRDLDFANEYGHFIERDPEGLAAFRETFLERREAATGRPINFASVGPALMWSPFYAVAHAVVAGWGGIGTNLLPLEPAKDNNFIIADNFSYIAGNHTMQTGISIFGC